MDWSPGADPTSPLKTIKTSAFRLWARASCESPLGSVCLWPASLLLLSSLCHLTWITFLSVPHLGPIALPVSLPALQHAVTTPNIQLSHSLPWKNRRMAIFFGALGALHPCFFFSQRHIGARMTKHRTHHLLACSVGTRSKFRWDAKVQFFSIGGFCVCKHCEWYVNTGVCSVPVFQCVLVSVWSPMWYLSEYLSTSAHRKHTLLSQ